MKINEKILIGFIASYYADKDIMHNMWHIELVKKKIDEIIANSFRMNRRLFFPIREDGNL